MKEVWFVYILECSDGTLYTGITNDLDKRIAAHNTGKGAKYTRGRGPVKLICQWEKISKSEALKFEYQIKQKSKKEKLIMANKKINQEILDQWEESHKREVLAVKQLGETIGYGNMMSIASALWFIDLDKKNYPTSGAFIPTITHDMKKKEGEKAVEEQKRRAEYFKKMLK